MSAFIPRWASVACDAGNNQGSIPYSGTSRPVTGVALPDQRVGWRANSGKSVSLTTRRKHGCE